MASTTMAVSSTTTQMGQGLQVTIENVLVDDNNHSDDIDLVESSLDEWTGITNGTNQNGTTTPTITTTATSSSSSPGGGGGGGGGGRGGGGGTDGDALEELSGRNGDDCDENCTICDDKLTSPKVLNCLHVFCESCLIKLLENDNEQQQQFLNDCTIKYCYISCPICGQATKVDNTKGISSLPNDYVLSNILDMTAIKNKNVPCTSCKAEEFAIARCSDCANFLCPNCNTAHQFMRCFEYHQVLLLDDINKLKDILPIHKPIYCKYHTNETMKFYCHTCQDTICNNCLSLNHRAPEHHCERLTSVLSQQKQDLQLLMNESKSKIKDCEELSTQLENALSELQSQHDQAKDLINENFQSYKAILEKCRDNELNKLDKLHSERELEVMDTFHNIEKTIEKIEDACKFTSRLIQHADTTELLTLKKTVTKQLLNLISNTPSANVKFSIEFVTDYKRFENLIGDLFGTIKTECTPQMVKKHVPDNLTLINTTTTTTNGIDNNNSQINVQLPCSSTISTTSPISLCGSMQSSFEGDTSGYIIQSPSPSGQNLITTTPSPPQQQQQQQPITSSKSLSQTSQMRCLTSIQEYNLQQLASLAEKVDLQETSTNPSPTPPFTLAELLATDLSSTSHAINNLQALAKLGNSMSHQDLGNGINGGGGGGLVLPRVTSPGLNDPGNIGGLSANNLLNGGYHSMSNSTSPILSQGTDELKGDQMHNMGMGNGIGSSGSYSQPRSPNPKQTPMQIRSKFGQLGPSKGQFNSPHGFCLGTDEDIIVADTNNHRIQIFDKTGQFKSQFGVPGKEEGQLWYPRKVAVMRNCGKFVVCDRGNERSRMQIFTKNGHFIKKIAIRYIDIVAGLAVTNQGHIVAVDSVSPTVFVINDNGQLLRWFDCSDYMREPSDIAISGKEFFVCDFKGHCVVVFNEEGQFQRRIGCENITNFPNGIDISDAGDVLIGDSHGNRFHVAVFSRDGSLISEFECPYVKVSRCCGLKITSEGYIVTLAKNNHHVLVLNTLYIL